MTISNLTSPFFQHTFGCGVHSFNEFSLFLISSPLNLSLISLLSFLWAGPIAHRASGQQERRKKGLVHFYDCSRFLVLVLQNTHCISRFSLMLALLRSPISGAVAR